MNRICLYFVILFSLLVSTLSFSATLPTNSEAISAEFIQHKIADLNARQGLDEAVKAAILKQYQAALDNLTSNTQAIAQIENFTAALHQAPSKIKLLQKEIEQASSLKSNSKQKIEDFRQIPVEELEQRLIIEKNKISQLDEQSKKLEADLALQNNRPMLIREETNAAQQQIEDARKKLEFSGTTISKLEIEAQQLYFKTLIETKITELKLLDVEAISQPARLELLKTQFQLLDIQKNSLAPIVATIENLAFDLREQEAKKMEDSLSKTEKEIENKHPLIQQYTRENIKYSRDLQAVTAKIEQVSDQKTQVETKNTDIENEFKSAEKKISLASLSPALGKILREQRRSLANQNEDQKESSKLQNEIELTSLEQFKIEDKQKSLLNLDTFLKQMMATQVEFTLSFEQRMMIQAELRMLLNNQKELLNKLALADATYLRTLGDLDFTRQQMLTQARKFAVYLDERLLWVQSSEPVNLDIFSGLSHSLQWLFSPSNWLEAGRETLNAIQNNRVIFSSVIGFLFFLIRLKNWASNRLKINATELNHWRNVHFYSTLQALIYQVLFILPAPIIVYLFGLFFTISRSTDFTFALGSGLQSAAISLFVWQFCYSIFAINGIARRHFQWHKKTVLLFHTHSAWLRFVIVLAVFFVNATRVSEVSEYSDSLGRLALIVMFIALAVFMVKLLKHNLWQIWLKNHFPRLRYVAFALIIAVPVMIIGSTIMGYYSSALELQEKLISSFRLLMLIVVAHEMVLRWLTLINRQLALKNAQQQNELHDKHILENEALLDIPKINAQTRKLLHVTLAFIVIFGFWVIWKNLLPAFSFLDHIVLWQHKVIVENQESYQPITLTNLLFASLYFFIAIVAVRNFYGVLELLVFRRWEIEVGSRYATNQLAKYFFVTIAFISIANELGGSWSQVQWLVAALGVGLGFGLQEIFANLVSGIILLFERPIRVGDVVTIGDLTGSVSRIQMRATTLIDVEQRELIVPNKTFITSQLTNWTLSNTTTRIVIPIGIAFDSDVEFTHDLMLQIVKETPQVLEEPAPCVLFIGFGESSLNFSICAFVNEPTLRSFVIHDLNMRLEKSLRENKIKIPYPQREVHIKDSQQ